MTSVEIRAWIHALGGIRTIPKAEQSAIVSRVLPICGISPSSVRGIQDAVEKARPRLEAMERIEILKERGVSAGVLVSKGELIAKVSMIRTDGYLILANPDTGEKLAGAFGIDKVFKV